MPDLRHAVPSVIAILAGKCFFAIIKTGGYLEKHVIG